MTGPPEAGRSSAAFLDRALAEGVRVAVVSSSRNAVPVLEAAGLRDRFDVIVDGVVAGTWRLSGDVLEVSAPASDGLAREADRLGSLLGRDLALRTP